MGYDRKIDDILVELSEIEAKLQAKEPLPRDYLIALLRCAREEIKQLRIDANHAKLVEAELRLAKRYYPGGDKKYGKTV